MHSVKMKVPSRDTPPEGYGVPKSQSNFVMDD